MGKHDAPPIWMQVKGSKLEPCSRYDEDRVGSYQNGARLRVTLWQGRNSKLLRKYWAILHRAVKDCNTPWRDVEEASDAIKLALGVHDSGRTINGQFFLRPGSISFSAMDESKFKEYFEQTMAILHRVTGVDPETLTAESADTGVFTEEHEEDKTAQGAPEVETATAELEITPEPDSDVAASPASEPVGEDAVASVEPPADEGGDQRQMQSPPSTDQEPDVDERFIDACRQMLAVPLMDGLDADKKAKLVELKDFWKGNIRQSDWPRLETLLKTTQSVLRGDVERSGALDYYAGLLDRDVSDLEPVDQ